MISSLSRSTFYLSFNDSSCGYDRRWQSGYIKLTIYSWFVLGYFGKDSFLLNFTMWVIFAVSLFNCYSIIFLIQLFNGFILNFPHSKTVPIRFFVARACSNTFTVLIYNDSIYTMMLSVGETIVLSENIVPFICARSYWGYVIVTSTGLLYSFGVLIISFTINFLSFGIDRILSLSLCWDINFYLYYYPRL